MPAASFFLTCSPQVILGKHAQTVEHSPKIQSKRVKAGQEKGISQTKHEEVILQLDA